MLLLFCFVSIKNSIYFNFLIKFLTLWIIAVPVCFIISMEQKRTILVVLFPITTLQWLETSISCLNLLSFQLSNISRMREHMQNN